MTGSRRVAISLCLGALTGMWCEAGTAYAARGAELVAAALPASAAIPPSPEAAAKQETAAASVVDWAHQQLGKPYVWGGTGPKGYDCSGLIQQAYASAGVHLPRGTIAQSKAGIRIGQGDLGPGDLVFSSRLHHVQLYIGDGKVIEAAHRGTAVRISKMLPGRMINAYARIPMW